MNQSNEETVTNAPEKIYLQMGDFIPPADFSDFSEVTWCKERINENDIEYVLAERENEAVAFGEYLRRHEFMATLFINSETVLWTTQEQLRGFTTQELYEQCLKKENE